jgi:hypothetical protein
MSKSSTHEQALTPNRRVRVRTKVRAGSWNVRDY